MSTPEFRVAVTAGVTQALARFLAGDPAVADWRGLSAAILSRPARPSSERWRAAAPAWATRIDEDALARELLAAIRHHRVGGLCRARLAQSPAAGWPAAITLPLALEGERAGALAARAFAGLKETLARLARVGADPILIHEAATAYGFHASAADRGREESVIWVRADKLREALREADAVRGGTLDPGPAVRVVAKLSRRQAFARLLSHAECRESVVRLPQLGRAAIAPGRAHALLLACVHPVAEGRESNQLVWSHDVHRIASTLDRRDWAEFARLAGARRVRRICALALRRAQKFFGTPLPPGLVLEWLFDDSHATEPSAVFVERDRRWYRESLADLRSLSTWGERLRFIYTETAPRGLLDTAGALRGLTRARLPAVGRAWARPAGER